jgi:thiamine-monophosphate kinase
MSEDKLTPIEALGEFGLIDLITRNFPIRNKGVLKGIGDDAAVVACKEGDVNVFSTDLLIEGVHFDLSYAPLRHVGYKSVVVNLSDIFAMNANPYGITVSIAISNRFPVEAVEELYAGIRLACESYGVDLLGGDTSSSRQGLLISVTAFGTGKENEICYRSGAQSNDLVCVTGNLGAAYAGFLVLDREKAAFLQNPDLQPEIGTYEYVVGRQLKPEVRRDVLRALRAAGIVPNAMMDISDGLASELHHICKQSECGVEIFSDKIPIDSETEKVGEEFSISAVTFALNGGEDYELLFTVNLSDFDKVRSIPGVSIIGHTTDDPGQRDVILPNAQVAELEAQGWQHFKNSGK